MLDLSIYADRQRRYSFCLCLLSRTTEDIEIESQTNKDGKSH